MKERHLSSSRQARMAGSTARTRACACEGGQGGHGGHGGHGGQGGLVLLQAETLQPVKEPSWFARGRVGSKQHGNMGPGTRGGVDRGGGSSRASERSSPRYLCPTIRADGALSLCGIPSPGSSARQYGHIGVPRVPSRCERRRPRGLVDISHSRGSTNAPHLSRQLSVVDHCPMSSNGRIPVVSYAMSTDCRGAGLLGRDRTVTHCSVELWITSTRGTRTANSARWPRIDLAADGPRRVPVLICCRRR